MITKGEGRVLEKSKKFKRALSDELNDIERFSESSLRKLWLNKSDEIWNQYLQDKK